MKRLEADRHRPWLIGQDEIWIDVKGVVRRLEDMDREYIVNVIAFILRDEQRWMVNYCGLGWLERRAFRAQDTALVRKLLELSAPEDD